MLLACLILLSALPLGGYAAQASPRYTVSASQDQTTDVGKTVSMTVSVAGGSYNAYDLALTYDTARLTYVSGRTADRDASVAEKGGSIRVIGYGADKAVSTAVVTLTFKTKATGTAEVKISSAKNRFQQKRPDPERAAGRDQEQAPPGLSSSRGIP